MFIEVCKLNGIVYVYCYCIHAIQTCDLCYYQYFTKGVFFYKK